VNQEFIVPNIIVIGASAREEQAATIRNMLLADKKPADLSR
jgi:hypothetical protein